jgi:osmotically-inducible protein OsmY
LILGFKEFNTMALSNKQPLVTLGLMHKVFLAVCLVASLSACAPLLISSVTGGAIVANDRRTSGAQLEDAAISVKAANAVKSILGDRGNVNVSSYNRRVLVTGEVNTEEQKKKVISAISKVENVQLVVDELAVYIPSALSTRARDTLTTTRVKANLIDAKDLISSAFRVITERGTVYLMGIVTQREADRATDLASRTPGVLRVVQVLEVISEAELLRMNPPTKTDKPAPAKQ